MDFWKQWCPAYIWVNLLSIITVIEGLLSLKWLYNQLRVFNTLRPRQDGHHFGRRYFHMHFSNENILISIVIPHPVASEHRWLVKAPRWIHSVPDVSGRRSWRRGCHARLWNLHERRHKHIPFVNIASLRSWSIKRRQWRHKLDYYGAVFAHLATGCGINAKDPSAKALAEFSRHLSAGFTDLNPAPRGLSL